MKTYLHSSAALLDPQAKAKVPWPTYMNALLAVGVSTRIPAGLA
jgi:hypothetical protein